EAHHALDRGAQLPGAQLHARPDARRRRRAVLPLELPRAWHRRARRGRLRALCGSLAVRQEGRLLRSKIDPGCAALVLRRRARAEEDPPDADRRAAGAARAERHADAAPRQPPVDHAGDGGGMEAHLQPADLNNDTQNDTLLRALAREPTAYTPVWLMRQAG